MTIRDELINKLLEIAQAHKDEPEFYEAVCTAIRAAKSFGCKDCLWCREGTCTKHFPGEEVGLYDICNDWANGGRYGGC